MTKRLNPVLAAAAVILLCSPVVAQSNVGSTESQLKTLLTQFLDGAGRNDKAMHARFWADDVIYTSGKGVVRTKADIMKSLDEPQERKAPNTTFSAEDVRINDQGDWAIVNFRLVAKTENDGQTQTSKYRNTGTFRRRNGQWQAVAWQATKIEEPTAK